MFLAIIGWFSSVVVFGFSIFILARLRAFASVATIVLLGIVVNIRPALFFLGLDRPIAEGFWPNGYWMESAVASVASVGWVVLFTLSSLVLRPYFTGLGKRFLPASPAQCSLLAVSGASVIGTLIAVGATFALIVQSGGLAQFMVAVKIEKGLAGSYWIRHISVLAAFVALYGFVESRRRFGRTSAKHGLFQVARGGHYWVLIALNMGANFAWGNRMNLALFGLVALFAVHFHVKALKVRELLIVGIVSLAVLQGLKVVRGGYVEEVRGLENTALTETDVRSISLSLHFAQFDALMLALRDTDKKFDLRYGEDFYNGLVSWIPRSFMPEKDTYHIGGWFRRVYEPSRVNGWPVTVIGSWYVNFGAIGIVFGAIFSGFFAGLIDSRYRPANNDAWNGLVPLFLGFFMFEGGFNTGTPQQVVLTLIPLYLISVAINVATVGGKSRSGRGGGRRSTQESPFARA